jgi:hypothetical protein
VAVFEREAAKRRSPWLLQSACALVGQVMTAPLSGWKATFPP